MVDNNASVGADEYEYDVFVSYCRRAGTAAEWVKEYFAEAFIGFLEDAMPDPRVFLDVETIEAGDSWPDRLRRGLSRSKLMVAVWNAPYFASPWCLAEWRSMQVREQECGLAGPVDQRGLVVPLHFADGQFFDAVARNRQRIDMRNWAWTGPAFGQSADFHAFQVSVRDLAEKIADRLDQVPPWQDWKVEIPHPQEVPGLAPAGAPRNWLGGSL